MSKSKFYPGWKMTWDQRRMYFSMIDQVCKVMGAASAAEREEMRKQLHLQAFNGPKSAKDINHLQDFDEIKKVCLAYLQPDNLNPQLRMVAMPLIRLRHAIREFPAEYADEVRRDKFAGRELDDLNEKELTDLRNTLTARLGKKARSEKVIAIAPAPMSPARGQLASLVIDNEPF